MKEIINFLINNDLIGSNMDFEKKLLITNTKLRALVCKELVKKSDDHDLIIIEEENEESMVWGTLVAISTRKSLLVKVDSVYKKVNVSEVCCHMTSVTTGFPESFQKATGFLPADKFGTIFAIIAAEIFDKKFTKNPTFGVIKMAPKTSGNSSFAWKEKMLAHWGMNVSQFIEPPPVWLGKDKKILLGVNLTKDFVQRIRSNMLVIKPIYVNGDNPDAILHWDEIKKAYNNLENPLTY